MTSRARLVERWQGLPWHRWRGPAFVLFVAFVGVGVWRVESTARRAEAAATEAQATADQLAEVIEAVEVERLDRCVNGRGDTRRAIVQVIVDLGDPTPAELTRLNESLDRTLSTSECR